MEDDRHWKTTLVGRRPTLEDKFGRLPLLKDYHRWKMFGKKPLMKVNLFMEDDLCWKTPVIGRQPLNEDDL